MELKLDLQQNDYLTDKEREDINGQINNIIEKHKTNRIEIERLVLDSVTALTVSESRAVELSEQGMLKRFWGGITGKNKNMQAEIDKGFARAQYSSQQTLQKLSEQNLMSFELITVVNNKLNSSMIEIESEINNIYTTFIEVQRKNNKIYSNVKEEINNIYLNLAIFFKQTRSDLIQIENRLDKVEKNLNLLNWKNSIEYQMFNGMEYYNLSDIEKIVCITRDFYDITEGIWMTSDLLILKATLGDVGLSNKQEISYIDFVKQVYENKYLYRKLVNYDFENIDSVNPIHMLIGASFYKCELLDSKDKSIIDITSRKLSEHGIEIDKKELKYEILDDYIKKYANQDINNSINIFEFILELLFNLSQIENIKNEENKQLKKGEEFYLQNKMENAYSIFVDLAEKGNSRAMYFLGEIFKYGGISILADEEKSLQWLRRGYERNDVLCSINYAYVIQSEDGNLADKILNENFEMLLKMAEEGDVFAQYELGELYYNGDGVEQEYREALKWYRKSAEQGNSEAENNIGDMYYYGYDVEEDYIKAVEWYKKSAEHGNNGGQYNLAYCYCNEEGIEQDYKKALKWYKKSAEQGNSEAENRIGDMYYYGYGVVENYNKALEWYKKSAEHGAELGQYNLAYAYYHGEGIGQDYSKAFEWYEKSAEQGNSEAENKIGDMYYNGDGVEENPSKALQWYNKSANKGNEDAKKSIKDKYNNVP